MDYVQPENTTIQLCNELLNMLNDRTIDIRLMKRSGITCTKLTDDVLFCYGSKKAPVTFFWRMGEMKVPGDESTYDNPVDPLILEAPHEGKDNTANTAMKLFEKTNAKVILFNLIHPKTRKIGGTWVSDPAHCMDTLYHKMHVKLTEMFPDAFVVQLHGWANTKNLMMCMNCYSNVFNRKPESGRPGPVLFGEAAMEVYNKKRRRKVFLGDRKFVKDGFRRPGGFHNTTVQARHLNGGNEYDRGEEDRGKFLHIEMGQPLIKRSGFWNYRRNVKKLAKVLNLTMEKWVKTPVNKDSVLPEVI